DSDLITTLIESWHPETNTFHIYQGEATITLKHVQFITRLSLNNRLVDRGALVSSKPDHKSLFEEKYLRKRTHTFDLKGGRLRMRWLWE
ncbi:Serine/threonine-protein phosphatase 7 long form homolog, partial [Linum perenne]